MGFIVDLIILGILVLCVALGYHKGLTGAILKIISFVLAVVIAFVLFKPVSNFVISQTTWDESLEKSIHDMIISNENKQLNENVTKENENQSMPTVMIEYINKTVENAGNEAKEAIADIAARNVAITIINCAVWIALFIIARIILIFVKFIADLITKLPVIKQFDKLGGIIYGIVEAVVIIYGILAIISFASPMLTGTGAIDAIQESLAGSIMYNNNLLLKLIF